MSIDLQQFCANENDPREYLQKPFRINGSIFATNGHVAIWIPDDQRDAPTPPERIHPNLVRHMEPIEGVYASLADLVIPPEEKCGACSGHGDCECKCGHYHDCEVCGGSGIVSAQRVDFQGVDFQRRYLLMLKELPGITMCVRPEPNSSAFRFDGGEGRIMPMKRRQEGEQ